MSRFIESIKVEDQKVFLTELHQKRMNDTFFHFGKECKIDIQSLFLNLEHDEDGLYKFRIEYDLDNNSKTQIVPYAISEHDDFELVIDNEIDYTFKSADRTQFQKMNYHRQRKPNHRHFLFQSPFFERQNLVHAENLSSKRRNATKFINFEKNKRNGNQS